jgi:hypothetical protein
MLCAISRKAGGAALAALLAIGAAEDAAAANFYRLVGIGFLPMEKEPPDLNASFASDVADLFGQTIVVGQSSVSIGDTPSLARGDFHAFRFQEGDPGADYGDLDLGGDTSAANAIDGTEQIAGRAETLAGIPPTDGAHAVIWPPPTAGGQIADISDGAVCEATAIGLAGIVGVMGGSGSQQGFQRTANGLVALPSPSGAFQVFVEDVNDTNTIVGHAAFATGSRAFSWSGMTTPVDLGDLDGDGGDTFAYAIDGAGWIVGSSDDDGQQRAFRRDPATGVLEGLSQLPGSDFSSARDGGSDGIVGTAWDPVSHSFHAALWDQNGTIFDLHDLVTEGAAGWKLEQAVAISGSGRIAGNAINPNGEPEGFLLVPLPEPGIGGMLVGGLLLFAMRWLDGRRSEATR